MSYLYVERECPVKQPDIGEAMGSAMREVWDYMQAASVKPVGPAIALYPEFDEVQVKFRAGFVIEPEAIVKADDDIRADVTPGGSALHATHIGPYENIGETYDRMMKHLERIGRSMKTPSWEVYVNDPAIAPPEELRTEIYVPTDMA